MTCSSSWLIVAFIVTYIRHVQQPLFPPNQHKSKSWSKHSHFPKHFAYCLSCNSQNTIFVLLKWPAFSTCSVLAWHSRKPSFYLLALKSTFGTANCRKHLVRWMLHVKLPIARYKWCPLTTKTAIWKTFCHWHVTKLSIHITNERLQSIYWHRGYYVMTILRPRLLAMNVGITLTNNCMTLLRTPQLSKKSGIIKEAQWITWHLNSESPILC